MCLGAEVRRMSDPNDPPVTRRGSERSDETDELRTLGFRLREIQRLLAVRVEQENRRLEAEGIDPVEQSRFIEDE